MRITTELAFAFAILISLAYWIGGGWVISTFISDPEARTVALAYLPYCALVPLIGVLAYQFDGFLLGATRGQALRSAAAVVTVFYIPLDLLLRDAHGNTGVWLAFLGMFVVRVAAHGWFLPGLIRQTADQPQPPLPQS